MHAKVTMSEKIKSEPSLDEAVETPNDDPTNMVIDEDDDGEEIVREIDVFLSPELSNQLYLMQFPLQQQSLFSPEAGRIRPRHCMIELDYQLPEDMEEFGQFHLPIRTYSSHTIPVSTHMALGKLSNEPGAEGLHLVPLSRVTQMRPSFRHVDEATRNATASTEDDARQQENAKAANLTRKPVTFQKKESERAAMARKSSYAYKKSSEESEIWHRLEVHEEGSLEIDRAMRNVICPLPQQNLLLDASDGMQDAAFNTEYVSSLNYLPLGQQAGQKEEGEDGISGVVTKLVKLMHLGLPIPYSVLRGQFPKAVSDLMLFQALGSCAFMVRGNLILQSRLMPLKPAIAQARTFILFLLHSMEVVHRSRLDHVYKDDSEVTTEAILMLLNQVGKKTSEGWKLKVSDDENVSEKCPSVVGELVQFWQTQMRRFGPLLNRYVEEGIRLEPNN